MAITAQDVKKLRDATGAGMMDAKKALIEAEGDFEAAIEILRVTGAAKVSSRSDREASNGLVVAAGTTLIQLGAETDFVAKNDEFVALATQVAEAVSAAGATDVESANAVKLGDVTVAEAVATLAAKIGEKLELAAVASYEAPAAIYLHRRSQDLPPQVGVMVEYEGGDDEFVRGIAMQIAAMQPQWVSRDDVPADVIEKERHVAELTAKEEGKPENIISRIVEGRLGGFFKEVTLLEQASVSDDKKTVGQLLKEHGVTVKRFVRLSAGA
ncbi:translation elongation factor Ts [Propioniciclava sinopodophylli]|uniref:translation elongation factor Ts n=1 Tax=Propioniciclava sinopodophylli TaxID=1837344 RepID=UPI00248FEA57|nr:translation elongation factor Ts [Propioniciclava sinopodophylli]